MDGVVLYLCLVQSDKLPVVTIENLDKVVHFHTSLLYFNKKDSYKPYVISFLFSVLLNYNRNYPGYTTTRKEDALDVVANSRSSSSCLLFLLYFKRGV
jgi:hypothetical protein